MYRIRPSVSHEEFSHYEGLKPYTVSSFDVGHPEIQLTPNQIRWSPAPLTTDKVLYIDQGQFL
jgi:homogentisate 1,2-dioxygenase